MRSLALIGLLCFAPAAVASPPRSVDDARSVVTRLEQRAARLDSERVDRLAAYAERADRVAALKAQLPSFTRDRKLQGLLAESRDLATELDALETRILRLSIELGAARGALLVAIDLELTAGSAREADLRKQRLMVIARLGAARRLHIPDETIAATDDAEDLQYKAGALRQSEDDLRVEARRLLRRAGEYRRQERLLKSRARADEQDVFADAEPHRGSAKRTDEPLPADVSPEQTPAGPTPPPPTTAGTVLVSDPTVLLSEVVDPNTLDELRRAEGTHDPASRAAAAERAAQVLTAQADRMHQSRLMMERRARTLRGERP